MFKALFLALNVRPNEEKQVLLLLGQGFFMGIFLATFQIIAETLFLNRLGEYLKEAILFSGFLGILTTALFSYLQNKISFAKLALGNLFLIFIFSVLIYLAFQFADETIQNYIIFTMFALTGPILAVSLLGFWGTFGRLFDLRQSKRIIGGIDIGQLSAAIITSFSFPFLQELIPETQNYLLISCVSIVISFVFLVVLTRSFDLSQAEESENNDEEEESTKIGALLKNQYVRLLSIFLLFSMIAFTFIQFSFQEVVQIQYPEENEMRNFLAVFNGSILILGLLLQTFVNDKIIGEYGLKVSLLILPVILAVFTVASLVSGFFFGYGPENDATFIWFFLFIALSRLFNFSLRDSLENPTFKLFFMPLDNRVRFDIQTKVEGLGNETSRFIAGILILGLSYLSFIELIHYSLVLVILIIGYFVITNKLYAGYRNNVKLKLERQQRAGKEESLTLVQRLVRKLESLLVSNKASQAIFSFKLIEKVEPQIVPDSINRLMGHDNDHVRDFAQFKMNELKGLSVSERYVITSNSSENSDQQVVSDNDLLALFQSGEIGKSRISKLSKSDSSEDRQYAAELLGNSEEEDNVSILIELLHDPDPKVRYAAIKTAQRKFNNEVLNALIGNLDNPTYSVEAANALTVIGAKALNMLDSAFYKSGQSTQTMLKIVQIIGRIGGNKAKDILWNKMDFPDKVMVSQVLFALGNSGFRAGISQIARIKYAIESDIEDIAWNLAAISEVIGDDFGLEIRQALEEEIDYDIDHIYMLLSMLYDAQSIQLVKENIESQTSEGVTYGIELLDVFLSEDLKQRIIPVLDDLSPAEKSKRMEIFFPRERLENKMALKFLLNRDFSQTNRWTKTCIIRQIGLLKIREFYFDLISNLFNPDVLIREMAAWALYEIDPEAYNVHVKRVNINVKRELDGLIKNSDGNVQRTLKFDKIMFLKKIDVFENVFGLVLADLIDITEEIFVSEGETLSIDDHNNDNFYLVYKGKINVYENGEVRGESNEGDFIGEMVGGENQLNSNLVIALEDSVLLKMKKEGFYDLLADNVKLAHEVLEFV